MDREIPPPPPHPHPRTPTGGMGLPVPAIGQTGSFASMDTKRLARIGRRKATPEEEAKLLSQATTQATIAAKSMLLSGATHATALTTAKAAAESILLPKTNTNAPYLSRRKAKQQATVVASMALMAAQNAKNNHHNQISYDMTDISDAPPLMFGNTSPSPTHGGMSRVSEHSGSNSSQINPPSTVIRRDFSRQDDPSSIAGASASGGYGSTLGFEDNPKSARMLAISKMMESPTAASHTDTADSGGDHSRGSGNWGKRKERSEAVAKLLMPLENDAGDVIEEEEDQDYNTLSQDKKDSQTLSYSSEDMNTLQESFSSEASNGKQKSSLATIDPISAIVSAFMCGSGLDTPEPNMKVVVKHRTQEEEEEEEEEDERVLVDKEILSDDTADFREPYQKTRAHPVEEEPRAIIEETQTKHSHHSHHSHHSRKSSENSSLGNAEIVRALESFERERKGASRNQAELKSSRIKESMEKLVLRALAASDSHPPTPESDTYQSPGRMDGAQGAFVDSRKPPSGSGASPSSRGMKWRRPRKARAQSDME